MAHGLGKARSGPAGVLPLTSRVPVLRRRSGCASQLRFLASLQEAWPHCSRVPSHCGDARWAVGVGSQLPLCRGSGCPGCCCSHCCALVPRCLLNAGPTATFLILYSIASPASLVFEICSGKSSGCGIRRSESPERLAFLNV